MQRVCCARIMVRVLITSSSVVGLVEGVWKAILEKRCLEYSALDWPSYIDKIAWNGVETIKSLLWENFVWKPRFTKLGGREMPEYFPRNAHQKKSLWKELGRLLETKGQSCRIFLLLEPL